MGFFSSLAFILGTGWDKKAHESIRRIELLASSLHARLPIFCPQTTNTPLYKGDSICFAAVAYCAIAYAVFRKERSRELVAKFETYRKIIKNTSPDESNVIDEIEYTMRTRPASFTVLWDYVGSVGYNEDMVTTVLISEWTVRKLCAGDIPSDISKACAMVQETILTASRLVVL
jgi:hypothetical protein